MKTSCRDLSRTLFGIVLAAGFCCLPGCGSDSGGSTADGAISDATADQGSQSPELVGTWTGREANDPSTVWSLTFTATTVVATTSGIEAYSGTYTNDATTTPKRVTTVITSSPLASYVGKTSNAIYKIEGTTLTFAGNEPGNTAVPTTFTSNSVTRVFTLTRQ